MLRRSAPRRWSPNPAASLAALLFVVAVFPFALPVVAGAAGSWSPAGTMTAPRRSPTATLLTTGPNAGKVLVAGGSVVGPSGITYLASAELYDPATNAWAPTGGLATPRRSHTATRLLDGRVLVAGGFNGAYLASAELYNPHTGLWSPAGGLSLARQYHTATLLGNGRVLVAGGFDNRTHALVELFDPATGGWSRAADLLTPRDSHTATLLPDGRVFVAGGYFQGVNSSPTLSATEVYHPIANTWSPAESMAIARYGHTATALADGRMLVAGGVDGGASVEIYRPDNNSWKATASLTWPRYAHTATPLPGGKVLIAGGVSADLFGAFTLDHTEVFDPAAPGPVGPGAWSDAGRLATPRAFHADVALAGGRVLAAGGLSDSGGAQRSVDTGEMHCPAATPPVVTRPPRLWIPFISRPPSASGLPC
jgi:N-acetylneuraminic acid mutarotase